MATYHPMMASHTQSMEVENMSKYTEMKAIYNTFNRSFVGMGITHLMNIGWDKAQGITDEDLEQFLKEETERQEADGGIFIMTPEFLMEIVRFARNWSLNFSPVETIQFAQKVKLYDTSYFK